MKQIVAINSNCYHGYSLEEAILGAKKAGFLYMELTATKGWTEHVMPEFSFNRLTEIKNLLRREGIDPIAMSGHCNLSDPDRVTQFRQNMALASFFDCRYIVSSVGEAHIANKVEDHELLLEHLHAFIPQLNAYGICLVLEVHGKEHGTGARLSKIVQAINNPAIQVAYDTANVMFYSEATLLDDLEATLDSLAYMHLKDKAGARHVWDFPALGEGWIDFPAVFELLHSRSVKIPWSIEIEFTDKGAKDVHEVDQALLTSAKYLQNLKINF